MSKPEQISSVRREGQRFACRYVLDGRPRAVTAATFEECERKRQALLAAAGLAGADGGAELMLPDPPRFNGSTPEKTAEWFAEVINSVAAFMTKAINSRDGRALDAARKYARSLAELGATWRPYAGIEALIDEFGETLDYIDAIHKRSRKPDAPAGDVPIDPTRERRQQRALERGEAPIADEEHGPALSESRCINNTLAGRPPPAPTTVKTGEKGNP